MKSTMSRSQTPRVEAKPKQAYCPGCGTPQGAWPGEGHTQAGLSYCCQECAEGAQCTCGDAHLGAVSD